MKSKGKKTTLASADYRQWIGELKTRYRATQIKAAIAVNSALIEFYWNLGKDIRNRFAGSAGYGSNFFRRLNVDLTEEFPNVRGFSERNLKYCLDSMTCTASRRFCNNLLQNRNVGCPK